MNGNYVSAVFDTHEDVDQSLSELREAGIKDSAISVMGRTEGDTSTADGAGNDTSGDFLGKAALGAGVGTALGVAALAIPGVGPLVAAGAIAAAAIPTAAVVGAAVGAVAGSLASVMSDRGIDEDDQRYYETRMGEGGILVSVDVSGAGVDAAMARDILYRNGGHDSRRAQQQQPR
ncbi:hypothetical protein [Sandarakinorhabdus rubra]|uniref:hypothetical protein n=1 Tax=Sandarakinorhabdus rubra TaxID=2672568 RepID=UPI0013D90987|nr:hypothetical protein [Sandarakinorhabdus rubra]